MRTKEGKEIVQFPYPGSTITIDMAGALEIKAEARYVNDRSCPPAVTIELDSPKFKHTVMLDVGLASVPDLYEALGGLLRAHTDYFDTLAAERIAADATRAIEHISTIRNGVV